jgi:hypothetical protein
MLRKKTLVQQDHLVFVHHDNYVLCPFHAAACHFLIEQDAGPNGILFRAAAPGKGSVQNFAKYLNDVLARLCVLLNRMEGREDNANSKHYTSHSLRVTSSSDAAEHKEMQIQWLIERGGWIIDHLAQIFGYLFLSKASDSRVGRALSNWPKLDEGNLAHYVYNETQYICNKYCNVLGAFMVNIEAILTSRELFQLLTTSLFGHWELDLNFSSALTASLVMHYYTFEDDFPNNIVNISFNNICSHVLGNGYAALVKQWNSELLAAFKVQNSIWLHSSNLEMVQASSVNESLAAYGKSMEIMHTQILQLIEVNNKLISNYNKLEKVVLDMSQQLCNYSLQLDQLLSNHNHNHTVNEQPSGEINAPIRQGAQRSITNYMTSTHTSSGTNQTSSKYTILNSMSSVTVAGTVY